MPILFISLRKSLYLSGFIAIMSMLPSPTMAESWEYEKKSTDEIKIFGETKLTLTTDATNNQIFPEFTLNIQNKDILQAQYRNVAYDNVFASADNSVFVGLSNDGLPGTAIIVFDNRGNLRIELKHRFSNFAYCDFSGFRKRVWYDNENPNFEFKFDPTGKNLQDMFVNDCHGKRVSVFTLIDQTYRKSLNTKKTTSPTAAKDDVKEPGK
jgi:hypothetical protein